MLRSQGIDAGGRIELPAPLDADDGHLLPFCQEAVDERLSRPWLDDLDNVRPGHEGLVIEPRQVVLVLEPQAKPPSGERPVSSELVLAPHIAVLVLPMPPGDAPAKQDPHVVEPGDQVVHRIALVLLRLPYRPADRQGSRQRPGYGDALRICTRHDEGRTAGAAERGHRDMLAHALGDQIVGAPLDENTIAIIVRAGEGSHGETRQMRCRARCLGNGPPGEVGIGDQLSKRSRGGKALTGVVAADLDRNQRIEDHSQALLQLLDGSQGRMSDRRGDAKFLLAIAARIARRCDRSREERRGDPGIVRQVGKVDPADRPAVVEVFLEERTRFGRRSPAACTEKISAAGEIFDVQSRCQRAFRHYGLLLEFQARATGAKRYSGRALTIGGNATLLSRRPVLTQARANAKAAGTGSMIGTGTPTAARTAAPISAGRFSPVPVQPRTIASAPSPFTAATASSTIRPTQSLESAITPTPVARTDASLLPKPARQTRRRILGMH